MTMARDRKYVIPFPNGITVPTEEFTSSAKDRMLRFPNSYWDSVMSSLKVLARPETYQTDVQSELNFSVQQGFDVLASVEKIPVDPTDLYATISLNGTNGGRVVSANDPYTGNWEVWGAAFDEITDYTTLALTVKSHPLGANAGGSLDISVYYAPIASKAYVATGHTCTGLISDSDFATDGFHYWHWDNAKDVTITLSAIYGSLWHIILSGDIVCGGV